MGTIYAPNARNRRNAFLRIRQWMARTAERICTKFIQKTCLVLCSDEFERQGQKLKVKVNRDKNALCTLNTPAVSTEWNAVVAGNVAQAANATSPSLVRGVSAGLRIMRAACGGPGGLPLGSATHFLCSDVVWRNKVNILPVFRSTSEDLHLLSVFLPRL